MFEEHYKLKRIADARYLTTDMLCNYLNISPYKIKDYLINSKTIFAVEDRDGNIFIHPLGVYANMQKKFKGIISRVLNNPSPE